MTCMLTWPGISHTGTGRQQLHMIFGLFPADPMTIASVSLTMLLVSTLAGYLPAFKAMKMNPVTALRHD